MILILIETLLGTLGVVAPPPLNEAFFWLKEVNQLKCYECRFFFLRSATETEAASVLCF